MTTTTTHFHDMNAIIYQPETFSCTICVTLFKLLRCVARAIVLRSWGQVDVKPGASVSFRRVICTTAMALLVLSQITALWHVQAPREACSKAQFCVPVFERPFRSSPCPRASRRGRVAQPRHMTVCSPFFPPIFSASFLSGEKPPVKLNHHHNVAHISDKTCESSQNHLGAHWCDKRSMLLKTQRWPARRPIALERASVPALPPFLLPSHKSALDEHAGILLWHALDTTVLFLCECLRNERS